MYYQWLLPDNNWHQITVTPQQAHGVCWQANGSQKHEVILIKCGYNKKKRLWAPRKGKNASSGNGLWITLKQNPCSTEGTSIFWRQGSRNTGRALSSNIPHSQKKVKKRNRKKRYSTSQRFWQTFSFNGCFTLMLKTCILWKTTHEII